MVGSSLLPSTSGTDALKRSAASTGRSRHGRDTCIQIVAVNRKTRRYRERTGYYWKLARVPKTEYPRPWLEEDQAGKAAL